jgi:hypothetical protein
MQNPNGINPRDMQQSHAEKSCSRDCLAMRIALPHSLPIPRPDPVHA